MKTEPIGLDYLLPVGVARAVAVVAGLVLLALVYVIVEMLIVAPQKWPSAIRIVFIGIACLAVIQRSRTVIPRLRDQGFQDRIRKFKHLKRKSWEAMLEQLLADPNVELLDEVKKTMANPLTWGRKQSVLTARDGDLFVELLESNGRVGSVRLQLIVGES